MSLPLTVQTAQNNYTSNKKSQLNWDFFYCSSSSDALDLE